MSKRWFWLAVVCCGLGAGLSAPAVDAEESAPPEAAASEAEAPPVKLDAKERQEYYELLSVLVDTLDQVERNYVKKLSRRELIEAAVEGVLRKLDPYSNYIAPDDITRFRTSVENEFGGIGIQITSDQGVIKILSPVVGSPAYKAGLQAGDRIVGVEGKTTEGLNIEDVVKLLKGEIGAPVTIRVVGPNDAEPREVTVKRELVHLETVLGDDRQTNDLWDYMLDDERKIGYIRLTAFSRDTADELKHALEELKKAGLRGLVLDLRFNPGGLLTSAIDVSDLFVTEGRIVSTEGRNTQPRAWDAHAEETFDGFPMAVLVNRYSASSSEIVAACLQDHHRAVVIGERTWGKGSVQNVVELEGGRSALKLTTASYKRPSGKNIHRFPDASEEDEWGVTPDEGYALKLGDQELRELVEYRRQRDIVRRRTQQKPALEVATATDATPPVADAPAANTPETSAPETNAPAAVPAKVKPMDSKPAENEAKPESAESKPQNPPAAEPAAPKPAAEEAGEDFADRQLAKALEYVAGELAKKP